MLSSAAATDALAAAVLVTLGLGLAGYLLTRRRRLRLTPAQTFWYGINVVVARLRWGARISGPLPAPPGMGAVIVCNHRSPSDPGFVELATGRVVRWMVAKEYCRHRLFGWFLRMAEVIPTSRAGIDTAATREAIRYARDGGLVGIFPEGRINKTEHLLLPGRPGAALIALKARVPVIPCYVHGSPFDGTILGCLWMSAKVELRVGEPIELSEFYGREGDREVLEALTRRFLGEIARLAGQPDFQPQLAGRVYKPQSGEGSRQRAVGSRRLSV